MVSGKGPKGGKGRAAPAASADPSSADYTYVRRSSLLLMLSLLLL